MMKKKGGAAMRSVYVVFSATPYKMGRFIRTMIGNPYNHVSLSLDARLCTMYTFARFHINMPFYGGFVTENLARYTHRNKPSDIKVCRIPISDEDYSKLSAFLHSMNEARAKYLYNTYSAIFAFFGIRLPIRGAYTCAEFVGDILGRLGMNIRRGAYHSLAEMEKMLSPYVIYVGPSTGYAAVWGNGNDAFFERMPAVSGAVATAGSLVKLTARGLHGACSYLVHKVAK